MSTVSLSLTGSDLGIPNVCIIYDGDVRPPRATYCLIPCDAGLKDPPHGGVVLEDLFGEAVLAAFRDQEIPRQNSEYKSFTVEHGHIKITQKGKLAFFRFVTSRSDCWARVLCLHAKLTGFVQELANRSPAAPTSP